MMLQVFHILLAYSSLPNSYLSLKTGSSVIIQDNFPDSLSILNLSFDIHSVFLP